MIEIAVGVRAKDTTRRGIVMVSDEDGDLSGFRWTMSSKPGFTRYARRSVYPNGCRAREEQMHRVVAARIFGEDAISGKEIDHINGNGLDNRRENLRLADRRQNNANRTGYGKSRFLGVAWSRKSKRWQAQLRASNSLQDESGHGKMIWLGYHDSEEDAARAYDVAALAHHGKFARVNFPS